MNTKTAATIIGGVYLDGIGHVAMIQPTQSPGRGLQQKADEQHPKQGGAHAPK